MTQPTKFNQVKKEIDILNYNQMPIISHKYVKTYFRYSDSDSSEDEGMEDYKVGGYHPVHVGYKYY